MLRFIFGEQAGQGAEQDYAETVQYMNLFVSLLSKQAGDTAPHEARSKRLRKLEVWAVGLRTALDELEQSHYITKKLVQEVKAKSFADMNQEELQNYFRYVYFDKNAFIRVFSLLDKLGTLLNDLLEVRTERVKPHYSYFTVLRTLRGSNRHQRLATKLGQIKEEYKEPVARLRKRRNTEIHYMNSEMTDDLIQSQRMYGQEQHLEDVVQQAADLDTGVKMVKNSLKAAFEYSCQLLQKHELS